MTYGLSTPAFSENGPQQQVMQLRRSRSPVRRWRALDERRRLEVVERALLPANEMIDTYPLAL
jgi:hypothetical protein